MKTFSLLVGVTLALTPCAFSQQLIADSVVSPNATAGTGSVLTLGVGSSTYYWGMAIGNYVHAEDFGIAIGDYSSAGSSAVALGAYANAEGYGSVAIAGAQAVGEYSYAYGYSSSSLADFSMVSGFYVHAASDYAIALGSKNLSSTNYSALGDDWVEDAVLFELGNGAPDGYDHYRMNLSNAITTLKNGQTTLTNKAWLNRGSGTSATADPSSATTDSGGEALVVEGHTRLKGKVTIEEPQGDISMGIYQ